MAMIELRSIPFPYEAMLSICSDLDETRDFRNYIELSRYLNTTEMTAVGVGLNIEVGNTLYFDMPASELSYWNMSTGERHTVRRLIKSGHIDCFHSYGDNANSRDHAVKALNELEQYDCSIGVWIDHAVAPSNFGFDIMQGSGDLVSSDVYHADITLAHGVKYVWLGRVSSVIGQNVKRRLDGIFSIRNPLRTGKTFFKEFAKGLIGRAAKSRYSLHARNSILQSMQLRDGNKTIEFLRSNPHPEGISCGDRGDMIGEVLTDNMLDRLESKGAISIVYTHLGKVEDCDVILPPDSIRGLKRVAQRVSDERLLVATTRRVLDYCSMIDSIRIESRVEENTLSILLNNANENLQGLSIEVRWAGDVSVLNDGQLEAGYKLIDHPTASGQIIYWPWTKLNYPSSLEE